MMTKTKNYGKNIKATNQHSSLQINKQKTKQKMNQQIINSTMTLENNRPKTNGGPQKIPIPIGTKGLLITP